MRKDKEKSIQEWLNIFNENASVTYKDKIYTITESELKSIYSTGNYWHSKTDPSSWLCEAVVSLAKQKLRKKLPRKKVLDLCAQLLNISPEHLENALDWNANYMAWHDGGAPADHHAWQEE